MKSFGGVINEDDLVPLLQGQQDVILEELEKVVADINKHHTEGKIETMGALAHVLEQATIHKQGLERDLNNTIETTEGLCAFVQQVVESLAEDEAIRAQEIHAAMKRLRIMLWGVLGSVVAATGIIAYLVTLA